MCERGEVGRNIPQHCMEEGRDVLQGRVRLSRALVQGRKGHAVRLPRLLWQAHGGPRRIRENPIYSRRQTSPMRRLRRSQSSVLRRWPCGPGLHAGSAERLHTRPILRSTGRTEA